MAGSIAGAAEQQPKGADWFARRRQHDRTAVMNPPKHQCECVTVGLCERLIARASLTARRMVIT